MSPAVSILLAVLYVAAAVNGLLVGSVLLFQERFGPTRPRLALAGFLIILSVLLALFVALDAAMISYSGPLGVGLDLGALLASGLFVDYVAQSVGVRSVRLWPYLPAGLFLSAAAFNGGRFGAPTEMGHIIAVQIAMTAVATTLWLTRRGSVPPGWAGRPENLRLPILLCGMVVFHAAQLLRLAAPENSLLFDLVPLLGAAGLLAFSVYAVVGSQTLRGMVKAPVRAADPQTAERLIDILRQSRAYLDPDLSLSKAALLAGLPPYRLSQALNGVGGFRKTVNALRIEEARRLLRDPVEAATSVEAVSALCGFRSRSRFYVAFTDAVGVSPTAYRASPEGPVS